MFEILQKGKRKNKTATPNLTRMIFKKLFCSRQRLDKRGGRGGRGPPGIFQDQAILVLLAPLRLENQAFLGLFWVLAPPEI